MTQISDLEKRRLLSLILNSPEFHDSKRYQELLQYLVGKSATGATLKEMEIAHDLFGKDPGFDPSTDPLIRSYISNLRKKLEHYYLTTENQFAFKLDIPKGQYLVTYTPSLTKLQAKRHFLRSPVLYLAIIFCLVLLLLYREFAHRSPPATVAPVAAVNPIWAEFLLPESQPILLVVGDYQFLAEKGRSVGRTFLRDPRINSEDDLRAFTKKNPGKFAGSEISDVSYVGVAAALGLPTLLQVFGGASSRVSIKLSSELKWDDFDDHCVVYVGSLKTLGRLDTLFSRTNIRYGLNPNTLKVLDAAQGNIKSFDLNWLGGSYQRDYSVILKIIGQKNNPMVFLAGFSEVGIMDAIKTSTDPGFMSRISTFLSKKTFQSPFLFEMISEAEGVRYTVFRSKIEYFEETRNPNREKQ
jgi:hypothetical protein